MLTTSSPALGTAASLGSPLSGHRPSYREAPLGPSAGGTGVLVSAGTGALGSVRAAREAAGPRGCWDSWGSEDPGPRNVHHQE